METLLRSADALARVAWGPGPLLPLVLAVAFRGVAHRSGGEGETGQRASPRTPASSTLCDVLVRGPSLGWGMWEGARLFCSCPLGHSWHTAVLGCTGVRRVLFSRVVVPSLDPCST